MSVRRNARAPPAVAAQTASSVVIRISRTASAMQNGMLLAILQFASDDKVNAIMRRLIEGCAPGSFVTLSHPASDIDAEPHGEMVRRMNQSLTEHATLRDRAAVTRLFAGLELVEPGVVRAPEWRPASDHYAASPAVLWVGVARKS